VKRRRVALAVALLAAASAPLRAEPPADAAPDWLPAYDAADASAAPVTAATLGDSERFWPYRVTLARPWTPPGRSEPLPVGAAGVLIRVESPAIARVDFGRDGLFDVPVDVTDLVELANRVRRGELEKMAPNFVVAIGPRLVDAAGPELRPLLLATAASYGAFMCVFADATRDALAALAPALAPLADREGVLTILFPRGERPDAELRGELRGLDWTVPFVYDHLAESYTRTLLADAAELPVVSLVTGEGRLLFERRWRAGVEVELADALDAALPRPTAAQRTPR
jgi:hypothetical protein